MDTRRASVLVVTDNEREAHFGRGVIGSLQANPRIRLAAQKAVSIAEAPRWVEHNSDIAVIVLVGFDAGTAEIVDYLRRLRPTLKIASFPVVGVHFSINLPRPDRPGIVEIFDRPVTVATLDVVLPSPDSPEFAEIISLLLKDAEDRGDACRGGEVVPFRPAVPAPERKEHAAEREVIASLLDKALRWVDEAAKALRQDPAPNGEIQPGLPVSLEWLAWLRGIENAPTEDADRAFKVFTAELDGSVARVTPLSGVSPRCSTTMKLR